MFALTFGRISLIDAYLSSVDATRDALARSHDVLYVIDVKVDYLQQDRLHRHGWLASHHFVVVRAVPEVSKLLFLPTSSKVHGYLTAVKLLYSRRSWKGR